MRKSWPLLLSLSIAPVAVAVDDADIARCAAIANALDRLDCYDALAERLPVMPLETEDPAVEVAPEPPVAPAAEKLPPQKPPPVAPTPATAADFGFEVRAFDETPDQIESRYDGNFTGWTGRTLFRLENGQVWQQAQSGRVSYRKERPMITIKKGAFGSFRLKVEGLNRTVRVRRIK